MYARQNFSGFPFRSGGVLVVLLALLIALSLTASPQDRAAMLQAGIEAYKSARYDAAVEMFEKIARDTGAEKSLRREALEYLGRCYIAKRATDKAREALRELLELEPPLVELDPDRESPPFLRLYYEVRKEKSGSPQVERPDPGIKTLAVIDFKNRSVDQKERFDPMEKGFADLLIHRLNGATDLKVVERERLQWILDEFNIQQKYSMEGAVRAGKLLGAHVVLLGSFIIVQDQMRLLARLVKVETGEILLTADVDGKAEKFFDLADKLSRQVARAIQAKLPEKSGEMGLGETNSLEAMITYSEGLALLEKGQYGEAYEKFLHALELDPGYERARAKAESIKYLTSYAGG